MAPAMNTNMLEHEAVQRNLETLAARGVRFVEPGDGYLACGWIGKGRLAEPDEIVEAARRACCSRAARCSGGASLVTAGPTYEDIDPVRYVGNRSSGRMGFAIAAEAARRGARVDARRRADRAEPPPAGVEVVRVRSARRDARGGDARAPATRTSSSWRPPSPTTRRGRRRGRRSRRPTAR